MRKQLVAITVAALLVLAGCSGGVTTGPTESATNGTDPATAASQAGTGTVNFYVSDERNAIDDFEHLNVTITKVGFHSVGDDDDDADEEEGASTDTETEVNETDTETNDAATDTNQTETTTETPESDNDDDADDEEDPENEESKDDDDGSGNGDWTEYDVRSTTVDLTELQGKNASLIDEFDLDNGTYDKVFIYVSDVNGTLKNGERVDVKLPSERMHVNKRFTIGNNQSVDFVFDITVVKRGNSGDYLIKPVVSESGTDVEIEDVDDREDDERDDDERDGEERDGESGAKDESGERDDRDSDESEGDENRGKGQDDGDDATDSATPTPTPTSTG